ncbi:MAG: tetratricopeptide repeat protein [Gammaproteobacteria bacterium]|nr:tetratricopeptide repeat protein [Gammaproteobacteria bacterium]
MSRPSRLYSANTSTGAKHAELAAENFAAGDLAQAERSCRRALARGTSDGLLWHMLAAILLATGRLADARDAIARARRLSPGDADFANTEALLMERDGDSAGAANAWRSLLLSSPEHADAWYNLGRLALHGGHPREAMDLLLRAAQLRPQWADAYKNLGEACFAQGDVEAAEAAFQAVLQCAPGDADSLANLARLRQEADDYPAAFGHYRAALAAGTDDATLLRFALLMPLFSINGAEVAAHRSRVESNLAALTERALTLTDPSRGVATPAFYFAYQGFNDRPLMSALGDIVDRAWRPAPLPRVTPPARPRIAFVSAHFRQHTIARLYAPLLERLPRQDFDVAVLSIGQHDGPLATRIASAADHALAVPEDLHAAREGLKALAPDVVVYCDIGMDPWSYYLAAERQAPVQCVTWGHPVTSGLASVDYFLSSQLLEPPNAQDHYREQLIQLPHWPVLYEEPALPRSLTTRRDFGFMAGENIYLCPQSLFKLHPDFDAYLAAILRRDPHGVVVLIDSRAAWRARLEGRFACTAPDVAERIRFVPPVSSQDFGALLAAADVVLDTLHFSGGYTSFETIWAETPFVTERGAFMRGRVTAGLCDLLGLDEALAHGAEDYAARAVALANAGAVRDGMRAKLARRKRQLLALDDAVLSGFHDFFNVALAQAEQVRSQETAP